MSQRDKNKCMKVKWIFFLYKFSVLVCNSTNKLEEEFKGLKKKIMLCDLKRLEFNFFIKVGNSFFIKIHVYILYNCIS